MDDKIEEIDLRKIIEILLKRKAIIGIITLAAVILGMGTSFVLRENIYESRMTMQVSNKENAQQNNSNKDSKSVAIQNMLDSLVHYSDMDFGSYLQEIKSEEVLEKTIKELKLEDKYTTSDLGQRLSVQGNEETQVITLVFQTKDPKLGVDIVNSIGKNFISHITEKSQEMSIQTLEVIKDQMEVEKEKYEEILREYENVVTKSNSAHGLELQLEGVFEQIVEYKAEINNLEIKKAGITAALEENAKHPQGKGGILVQSGEGDSYLYMDDAKKALNVELADTNARIESTKRQIRELEKRAQTLQVEYQKAEYNQITIRQKVEIAKESYEAFATKYEELNMASTVDIGEMSISIISEATSSTRPGSNKKLKLAIFLILGLMTGIIVAFIQEYWQNTGNRENKKEKTNKDNNKK
ncbi:GumC family protein [Wansuia hejianensis]|uniref:Polysaccharide chain length determinant N-terminal domain-containing protein n=1 Tax=Wansuia hejianensis TaxID=2763667 RepID=A0A926F1F1_9FIRM|nr:Wzz/FepE/Etk N-terminal domain-containing protein [Wansuia hejianensis]MBC8590194.1 hypothetical protein [Wansuia hejianensis]